MYKYETHLHTFPVSRCSKSTVRENLEYYHDLGYDGIFITNHFLDGHIGMDASHAYEERISFFFSDYEAGLELAPEIGIKVFCGVETNYKGTDFLVYGLDKEWFLSHPEIMELKKTEQLSFFMEQGALVIQAHPFREAAYIDHIRLFPRCVHGVEVLNSSRPEFENAMAKHYAQSYGLLEIAGSDNHHGRLRTNLAGLCCKAPVTDERDFVKKVLNREMEIFTLNA